MKSFAVVAILALAAALPGAVAEGDGHPIEKVMTMLGGLSQKVEFEAKQEALLYAKYEKWCQDSTKTLSKAIKSGEEAMSVLEADISSKEKEIATLSKEIDGLTQTLDELATAGSTSETNRKQAASLYQQASLDLNSTIAAFTSAIEEMVGAKGSMISMVQVLSHPKVREALALAEASAPDGAGQGVLAALQESIAAGNKTRPVLKAEGDYGDHVQKYAFKSDNVIELLKGLKAKFEEDLLTATKEETNSINAYNLAKQARDGEITAATKSKREKSAMLVTSQQDLTQFKGDMKNAKDDYAADTASLKSTEQGCQVKKREWDERSKVREQEQEAMKVAVEILAKASGVRTTAPSNPTAPTSPIAAGNDAPPADGVPAEALLATGDSAGAGETGSFASIQRHEASSARASPLTHDWNEKLAQQAAPSFLQVSEDPRQRAVQLLRKAAATTHSHALERLAQELSIQQGSAFDQVVNTIQKMIFHLQDEQIDEDKHKMWCDEELMKTNTSKADKEDKIEELRLKIEKGTATVQSLTMDVKADEDMVAQITSFVAEATEIRTVGKRENAEALKDAQQAQDAIAQATSVLEAFYKDSGMLTKEAWEFVQQPVELPNEPSTWSSSYTGVSDPAGQPAGIITVLQRIGSDFATMEADTRAQEETDQREFEDQMKESAIEKARREKEVEMKEQEKKRLLSTVDELRKSRKHLVGELEAVTQYLKDLEPACVTADSTYEDRKSARTEEIEALKMSEQILKDAFKQNKTSSDEAPPSTNFLLRLR